MTKFQNLRTRKKGTDISNQFKDLPIGELISSPLKAVVDVQRNMVESTSKFIKEVDQKTAEDDRYGKSYRK